jgi:hypothetical protein
MGKRETSRIAKEKVSASDREAAIRTLIRLGLINDNRTLNGLEREHIWTLLNLLKPVASSNNQRTITDVYRLNEQVYHVTYGLEEEPIIEEIHERTLD